MLEDVSTESVSLNTPKIMLLWNYHFIFKMSIQLILFAHATKNNWNLRFVDQLKLRFSSILPNYIGHCEVLQTHKNIEEDGSWIA